MSTSHIVRAWKDEQFRANLSEEERAALPANPAGAIELPDDVLAGVSGGGGIASFLSFCRTVCGVYCAITKEFNCSFKL